MHISPILKMQGMVLWMVLIVLQLMMQLTLHEYAYLFQKRFLQIERWHRYQNNLSENKAFTWVRQHFMANHCLINQTIPNEWRQPDCLVEDNKYYYAIQYLTNDPCGLILNTSDNNQVTAEYYRIILMNADQHIPLVLLQRTLVVPIINHTACKSTIHFVKPGYQGMTVHIYWGTSPIAWHTF